MYARVRVSMKEFGKKKAVTRDIESVRLRIATRKKKAGHATEMGRGAAQANFAQFTE